MKDNIRVGVVGTSWWADSHHLPHLKSHPRAEITAICGRNRDRAQKVAEKFGIPTVYTDYNDMIEKGNLQALVASVPDNIHYDVVMAALDAGLHVICEKPMAENATQAEEMYNKAVEKKVKHMTYFTLRWMPHYRYIKHLIDEGFLGKVYHCHFQWFSGLALNPGYQWRFDQQKGSGILGDLGSHMLDFALWSVGDINAVSTNLSTFVDREAPVGGQIIPANDSAIMMLDFESGAQGMIHVSAVTQIGRRLWDQRMLFHGEAGSIEISSTAAGPVIYAAKKGESDFKTMEVPDDFWKSTKKGNPASVFTSQSVGDRLFIDSIIEDKTISPGFEDGLKVQKILDAAKKSSQEAARILID